MGPIVDFPPVPSVELAVGLVEPVPDQPEAQPDQNQHRITDDAAPYINLQVLYFFRLDYCHDCV